MTVSITTKSLFSQHYLDRRLPDHPEWQADPRPIFEAARTLWQAAAQSGQHWNEAQTEQEFVKPMLDALGWSYIVQTKSTHGGKVTRPDYALFADVTAKKAAYDLQSDETAFYSQALAIAEAKYWGRPLSQKDATGRDAWKADGNPSYQIVGYLVGTHAPWGILTNGPVWRLYSREVSSTASEFYEIDLSEIFAAPDAEAIEQFKRFWLFFRRDAYLPDAGGRSFVQRVLDGSATYAREVSDKLKELIFEEVMPEIAGGFVAYRYHRKGVREETGESLRAIYQASLSLLYKLLFVLYAEARALLPVGNAGYREQSLTELARWAADRLDKRQPISDATHATPRYDALLALFHRIDQGDPSLGVPRYNGGLFDPDQPDNRFLEAHRLSDRAVARAVDVLVRDAGQPVDYAYISVRNLGAIYEGLLENRLRVVDAAAGQVELVNDKGERKASGSYYTPDYIVEYIVQHTLDPILDERDAQFRTAMARCADVRRQLERAMDKNQNDLLQAQRAEAEREAREAFLSIKALDPAMGSGHFLVNAVDHLTDGVIERMQRYHDEHPDVPWAWNPVQRLVDQVRQDILSEMARQGIEIDPARLDDTALLTRLVMKRCIYGVDLNPMAVELAKLSLWLHSFTIGAPLSFLDHHLRWGNSLIGAEVRTVDTAIRMTGAGQLSMFQGPFAGLLDLTSLMIEVAEQSDATLADARHSAEAFAQFQRDLTPYKQVLDLWVSQYFGNKDAEEFLKLYGSEVLPALRGERKVEAKHQQAIARARELWQEKRFFHWDLEFPEVFIDLRRRDWAKNPGFDAVIGNPPYVFITSVSNEERNFYSSFFKTCDYRFDLFGLFLDLACDICVHGGSSGFIVPHNLLNNNSFHRLREKIIRKASSVTVIDFSDRVFSDASNEPMILVMVLKSELDQPTVFRSTLVSTKNFREVDRDLKEFGDSLVQKLPGIPFLVRESVWIPKIIENHNCRPMSDLVRVTQGLRTGDNDRFLSDKPLSSAYRKAIAGSDVARYACNWSGTYVLYDRTLLDAARNEFFWQADEKIIVQEIRNVHLKRRVVACIDSERHIGLNTTNIIVLKPETRVSIKYLMAVLSSQLINEYFRTCFVDNHIATQYILSVPIFNINFITPSLERQDLVTQVINLCKVVVTDSRTDLTREDHVFFPLSAFIAERLAAEPEQSDVVHDLLAHLAEQMIAMHKEKQERLRAFRLDLGGYLDAAQMDRLNRLYTPKKPPKPDDADFEAKQAAYGKVLAEAEKHIGALSVSTLDLDDFWKLDETGWMWALRQRLKTVERMSDLVALFERHRDGLAPLMRRIERTDWLIDRIVYQLYGLTEEEIAIVEGRKPTAETN